MEKFNSKIEAIIGDNIKSAEIPIHELDKISPGSMIDLEREKMTLSMMNSLKPLMIHH